MSIVILYLCKIIISLQTFLYKVIENYLKYSLIQDVSDLKFISLKKLNIMKKIILLISIWSMVLTVNAQQIGNGYTVSIPNFNAPLLSGAYHGTSFQPNFPAAQDGMSAYLLTERSIANKNFQMQIASSMIPDDRLFFRKLAMQDLSNAPNSAVWHEVATRGHNTFTGSQTINGNIYMSQNTSVFIGGDNGYRLRLHSAYWNSNAHGACIDYYDNLLIRTGEIDGSSLINVMKFSSNGNVGIGITNPGNKLDVNGTIRAKEVKVETGWADFVFNDDYHLKPLSEVNTFIKENKHLPEIPSAAEVKENEGVNVGEMQIKLLQKIEELTLYVIQQNEKIQVLETELKELKNK
jgi:hypothetical protein